MKTLARSLLLGAAASALWACGGPVSKNSRHGDLHLELSDGTVAARQVTLDFGAVGVGQSARQTVQVVNLGADRAQITQVRFEDTTAGAFFVQAPEGVNVGERQPVTVTFAPREAGRSQGRLVLEHDGISISATLHLLGTAD